MAEDKAEGAAAPGPIETVKLVTLPVCGKTVEIKRWSYQRGLSVAKFMYEMTSGLPDSQVGDEKAMMRYFFDKGGAAYLEVIKLSVSPAHAHLISEEIDAVDAEVLIEAVFKLNETGRVLKNGISLAGQFALGKMRQMVETKAN